MKIRVYIFAALVLAGCAQPAPPAIVPQTEKTDSLAVKPAIDFEYDKALAFVTINPIMMGREFIRPEKIDDSVSKVLIPAQIQLLNSVLTLKYPPDSSEQSAADCFNPRHHVYFLDASGKVVRYITVCFECGNYKTNIETQVHVEDFALFFNSIGFPNYFDFSEHVKFYGPLIKKRE